MLEAHVPGMRELREIYGRIRTPQPDSTIAGRLLSELRITCKTAAQDLANIPKTGPAVMVLNHPMGLLEGAVLIEILRTVRPDVRFLANQLLASIPELRQWVIAVDPMGNAIRDNVAGMKQAVEHLEAGGLLVVFPAGEVSHFQLRRMGIHDGDWHPSIARIVALAERRRTGVKIVPAFVSGKNSFLFQCAGIVHPRLRTLLLVRELLNKKNETVELRAGSAIAAEKLLSLGSQERTDYLRWRCELLSARNTFKARTRRPLAAWRGNTNDAVATAADPALLAADVASLDPSSRLLSSGGFSVWLAPAAGIPNVLREIGRLREIAFRAAGEGTGKAADLDEFDASYLHLFVWNDAKQEIAGAYRLAASDTVTRLYTSTLFRYDAQFLARMGPALELGRSFVRVEYQKSFAPLLLLWKGIGRYIAAHPQYKVLFGPVSISNSYQAISRELMVGFLERYAQLDEWKHFISVRNPFRSRQATPQAFYQTCTALDDLASVVADIEPSREGVPVLLRQYLKLGGKLLGFNVDPEFSNALDGLIVVDLTRTGPRLLERYLGKDEAQAFLQFHGRS